MAYKSKFKKEFCEMLIDHMAEGLSYDAFAGLIGVPRRRLYKWEESRPEFKEAKEIGFAKMLLYFERIGLAAIRGDFDKFNASTYIFTMKNKCKWQDTPEPDQDDNYNLEFTSGNAEN